MTTATSGTDDDESLRKSSSSLQGPSHSASRPRGPFPGDDDDVVTMEMVEEKPPRELLSPSAARLWFLSLAGVAGLALLAAILIIVIAPKGALTWLLVSLVVLVVVLVAEVVLLILARPKKAS